MKLYPESVWKLECGAYSVETRLPTTNCSALLKSGLIPDPYKGLNEKETLWIGEKDTVLETSFEGKRIPCWKRRSRSRRSC